MSCLSYWQAYIRAPQPGKCTHQTAEHRNIISTGALFFVTDLQASCDGDPTEEKHTGGHDSEEIARGAVLGHPHTGDAIDSHGERNTVRGRGKGGFPTALVELLVECPEGCLGEVVRACVGCAKWKVCARAMSTQDQMKLRSHRASSPRRRHAPPPPAPSPGQAMQAGSKASSTYCC